AHPHFEPREEGVRYGEGWQYLYQPQPDWCGGWQPALWWRRFFGHWPEGRRPALPAALHHRLCRSAIGWPGAARTDWREQYSPCRAARHSALPRSERAGSG